MACPYIRGVVLSLASFLFGDIYTGILIYNIIPNTKKIKNQIVYIQELINAKDFI